MRILDPAAVAKLETHHGFGHLLALEFDTPIYLTDLPVSKDFGGNTYQPTGHLLGLDEIVSTTEINIDDLQIELSAADQSIISALASGYINVKVKIHTIFVEDDYSTIDVDENVFTGLINSYEEGESGSDAKVTIEVTNEFAAYESASGIQANQDSHNRFFLDDTGLRHVRTVTKPTGEWGHEDLSQGGGIFGLTPKIRLPPDAVDMSLSTSDYYIPVVYGEAMVTTIANVFKTVSGRDKRHFHVVDVICMGEVEAIELQVNGYPSVRIEDGTYYDAAITAPNSDSVYDPRYEKSWEFLERRNALQHIDFRTGLEGEQTFQVLDDYPNVNGRYEDNEKGWTDKFDYYDGGDTTAIDDWKSTDRFDGLACCYSVFRNHKDLNWGGNPSRVYRVKGRKVYDPRTGSEQFSSNPVLVWLDYFTNPFYGWGKSLADVDIAHLITEADFADTLVLGNDGSTRPLMTFNGVIDTSRGRMDNMRDILRSCRAKPVRRGELWSIRIERDEPVVMDLDDGDFWDITVSHEGIEDRFNRVLCEYTDKEAEFQTNTAVWPPDGATYNTYLTEDRNIPNEDTLRLPGCDNHDEAIQAAMVECKLSREGMIVTLSAMPRTYQLEGWDVISLTDPSRGWNSKLFRVLERSYSYEADVQLTLIAYDGSIYPWASKDAPGPSPDYNLPSIDEVPSVQNLQVLPSTNLVDQAVLDWEDEWPFTMHYRLQVTSDIDGSVAFSGTVYDTQFPLKTLPSGDYTATVWIVSTLNRISSNPATVSFSVSFSGYQPDPDFPETPVTLQLYPDWDSVVLQWPYPTYFGHKLTRIYRNTSDNFLTAQIVGETTDSQFIDTTVSQLTTYYYWIAYINTADTIGPQSASVQTTTTAQPAEGQNGDYYETIYRVSASQPSTPTGNNPTGWTIYPPSGASDQVWASTVRKNWQGVIQDSWSLPAEWNGTDGDDGDDGLDGAGFWHHIESGWDGTQPADSTLTGWLTAIAGRGPINNDILVVSDGLPDDGKSAAYTFNGSSWAVSQNYITGDLIVDGTVTTAKVKSGSFVGKVFTGGTFQTRAMYEAGDPTTHGVRAVLQDVADNPLSIEIDGVPALSVSSLDGQPGLYLDANLAPNTIDGPELTNNALIFIRNEILADPSAPTGGRIALQSEVSVGSSGGNVSVTDGVDNSFPLAGSNQLVNYSASYNYSTVRFGTSANADIDVYLEYRTGGSWLPVTSKSITSSGTSTWIAPGVTARTYGGQVNLIGEWLPPQGDAGQDIEFRVRVATSFPGSPGYGTDSFKVSSASVSQSGESGGVSVSPDWSQIRNKPATLTYTDQVQSWTARQNFLSGAYNYYTSATAYSVNFGNSDIVGLNSIYFNDEANSASEGIMFPRNASAGGGTGLSDWSSIRAYQDNLLFAPNANSTSHKVVHAGGGSYGGNMTWTGSHSFSLSATFSAGLSIGSGVINHTSADSYDKIRVYNSSSYTIGMKSSQTFGWLNDWATTFTMNNETDRGWLFRDTSDSAAQGAMSLTTDGKMMVANRVGIGGSTTFYIAAAGSSYGSFACHGEKGGWAGWNIQDRIVFMHDGSSAHGIYDDVNNKWSFLAYMNGESRLYYSGGQKLATKTDGVTVTGALRADSVIEGGVSLVDKYARGWYASISVTDGAWARVARADGGSPAIASWFIRGTKSGKHTAFIVTASCSYGQQPLLTVQNISHFGSVGITDVRLEYTSTNDSYHLLVRTTCDTLIAQQISGHQWYKSLTNNVGTGHGSNNKSIDLVEFSGYGMVTTGKVAADEVEAV